MHEQHPSDSQWFNPIAPTSGTRVSRRFLVGAGVGASLATMAPHLRLVAAQEATPAIDEEISGDEEAVTLLRAAAEAMTALETFKFELETVKGESTIMSGITLEGITGSVRRPTDFTAVVTAGIPFGTIDVTATSLDGQAWIQNPLEDGAWIELGSADGMLAVLNPDSVILASINIVSDAKIDGTEKVDGVDTTRVTGMIDLSSLKDIAASQEDLPAEFAGEPLYVTIWIDGENLVTEIELDGPILTSESDDVMRSVRFFDFNEPVELEDPGI